MNREFTSYKMAGHVFPKEYSILEYDAPPLAKGVIKGPRRLLVTSSIVKQTLHMTVILPASLLDTLTSHLLLPLLPTTSQTTSPPDPAPALLAPPPSHSQTHVPLRHKRLPHCAPIPSSSPGP